MNNDKLKEMFDNSLVEGFTISNTVATWAAYKLAVLIKLPFRRWKLYIMGIIDEKGEIIREPETATEKNELTPLVNLVRKIKQVMNKFIPDSSVFNTFVALYLLKQESVQYSDLRKFIIEELNDEEIMVLEAIVNNMLTIELEENISHYRDGFKVKFNDHNDEYSIIFPNGKEYDKSFYKKKSGAISAIDWYIAAKDSNIAIRVNDKSIKWWEED